MSNARASRQRSVNWRRILTFQPESSVPSRIGYIRDGTPAPVRSGALRFFAWAFAGILLCATGYMTALSTRGMFDDSDRSKKILELTSQDIDPETTLIERSLLKQGQIDARLAIALWSEAQQQLSGDALRVAQQALKENKIVPVLAPLTRQLVSDFDVGKAAVFVIWIVEDESQKGGAVELRLDGIPLGNYAIEPNRYALTIVERSDLNSHLEIKGLSDSNGGIVFRAETATSQAETRHLSKGKSDSWQIFVR
jgi:hypothetical protein